jgi:hypothetical protein
MLRYYDGLAGIENHVAEEVEKNRFSATETMALMIALDLARLAEEKSH